MKRIFRVQVRLASKRVQTIYVRGVTAMEVRAKLIRNGHREADVLHTTAIADAEPGPNGVGKVG